MSEKLANAQTLLYAEEFSRLHANERAERQRAEAALVELERSYDATVRALATPWNCGMIRRAVTLCA